MSSLRVARGGDLSPSHGVVHTDADWEAQDSCW